MSRHGLAVWCRDNIFDVAIGIGHLVLRPGLDMAGRPCVETWNWCRDRAGPLGVATGQADKVCNDRARAQRLAKGR